MGASRYSLRDHNGLIDGLFSVQQTAAAVIAIVRFMDKSTWDFAKVEGREIPLTSTLATYDDLLILQNKCLSLQVQQSKSNHTHALAAQFSDPDNEILYTVAPGDWILCWMADNEEALIDVQHRLLQKKPCNGFMDGLKFVGRVQSVRQSYAVNNRGTGMAIRRTVITGVAFQELDTFIYYDPQLISQDNTNLSWMPDISGLDSRFSDLQNNNIAATTNDIFALMLEVFLGRGPGKALFEVDGLPKTPNEALLIPDTIARILGRTVPHRGEQFTYSDILAVILGVQKYDGDSGALLREQGAILDNTPVDVRNMLPIPQDYTSTDLDQFTNTDLQGVFIPIVQPWNAPIWQILGGYLNPAVNEMYTALKVGYDGTVMPHLIVRQIPFNTTGFEDVARAQYNMPVTTFMELPRWLVDPTMVEAWDIGRSDSLRVNYCHVMVAAYTQGSQPDVISQQNSRIFGDPNNDHEDIKRHGLRMFNTTVVTSPNAFIQTPSKAWSDLAMDRLEGGHLRASGGLRLSGITEPISPGDNIEYDDVVYHVEDLEHSMVVDGEGRKSFTTTLQLSNGLLADGTKVAAGFDPRFPYLKKSIAVVGAIGASVSGGIA